MSAAETSLLSAIAQVGFPIAMAVYLLYERQKNFNDTKEEMKSLNEKWSQMNSLLLDVVKANTVAQTELRTTIEKLCDIVNEVKQG